MFPSANFGIDFYLRITLRCCSTTGKTHPTRKCQVVLGKSFPVENRKCCTVPSTCDYLSARRRTPVYILIGWSTDGGKYYFNVNASSTVQLQTAPPFSDLLMTSEELGMDARGAFLQKGRIFQKVFFFNVCNDPFEPPSLKYSCVGRATLFRWASPENLRLSKKKCPNGQLRLLHQTSTHPFVFG